MDTTGDGCAVVQLASGRGPYLEHEGENEEFKNGMFLRVGWKTKACDSSGDDA